MNSSIVLLTFITTTTTCSLALRAQENQYSSIPLSTAISRAPEVMMDPMGEVQESALLSDAEASIGVQSKTVIQNQSIPSNVMDTTMHNSVSSTDGRQTETQNSTPEAPAEEGTLNGVSVTQDNVKSNQRLNTDDQYQQFIRRYVPTKLDPSTAFRFFVNCNNRDGHIDKKIKEYETKRLDFPSDSKEYETYSRLISLLEKAKIYHNQLIARLISSTKTNKFGKPASKQIYNDLERLKLNSRPNKIERTISEIETDCEQLKAYKERCSTLEAEQAVATANNGALNTTLQNRIDNLNKAITHQQGLIDARCDSVQYIHPPYEELDPTLQRERDQNQLLIVKQHCLAQRYNLFEQRVVALVAGNQKKVNYLNDTAACFYQAAQEAQKAEPQECVINWSERAAVLAQKAVNEDNMGEWLKASHINEAAMNLKKVAYEAQKAELQTDVINLYERAATLAGEAANTFAEDTFKCACLLDSAIFMSEVAKEAQKAEPQARVIDWFERGAVLAQEAANAGNEQKARYLKKAATFLVIAAEKAQKAEPEDIIQHYLSDAEAYQQNAQGTFCIII